MILSLVLELCGPIQKGQVLLDWFVIQYLNGGLAVLVPSSLYKIHLSIFSLPDVEFLYPGANAPGVNSKIKIIFKKSEFFWHTFTNVCCACRIS